MQGLVCLDKDPAPTDFAARAEAWIMTVTTLGAVVASLVEDLHLLGASPGYDISHSEPQWLARIFVSIPDRFDDVGALRFAESVVHEAMHLQLTLFETEHPVVADLRGTLLSPWRSEHRPFSGVVHGLYVFTCLRSFFHSLRHAASGPTDEHVSRRIQDIKTEIASIKLSDLTMGLTPLGAELAREWHARGVAPL
jgi:HEXXH motif-containing protein